MDSPARSGHPRPAFACTALTKSFGPVRALDHLDLEVARGTLLGLLGPNGAGKTTLIRILLGLTPPTSGRAMVLGEPVPARSVLPSIGYMPQSLAVYTDLRVRQNLELFGRLQGVRGKALGQRTSSALELVHLTDRRESRVSELSGGMQRRVSLAGALLADPQLLLLDEPTVGVDPELRSEFWEHFRRLTRAGKTVVMTTHYMEEATRCDRVVMLHGGRVLQDDRPAAIKARTGASSMDDAFLVVLRERADAQARGTA
jgi:ABC-2 type transport system ATP-binding protein